MNVLLIEPNQVLGGTAKTALEKVGLQVRWRRSAQAAVDALDEQLPDVIVLEIQLGIHNGIEFLYELRSYPEWQQVPIIIHTINKKALDSVFAAALEQLGVRAVLYKPNVTGPQLARSVQQLAHIT